MADPQPKPTSPALRPLYFVGGLALVGLGIVGAFLPVMPSTIFFILAVACFARSSPRLEAWILNHPKFGPPVRAWRESGAIPRPVKIVAVSMMFVSMTIVCLSPAPEWVDWLVAVTLIASATFVLTRPVGPKAKASVG
jgi:uncharacterized membrane protein YbaN (DUF454 family)